MIRQLSDAPVSAELKAMARLAETAQDYRDIHREIERRGIAHSPSMIAYGIMIRSGLESMSYLYCDSSPLPWLGNTKDRARSKMRKLRRQMRGQTMFVVKLRIGIVETLKED